MLCTFNFPICFYCLQLTIFAFYGQSVLLIWHLLISHFFDHVTLIISDLCWLCVEILHCWNVQNSSKGIYSKEQLHYNFICSVTFNFDVFNTISANALFGCMLYFVFIKHKSEESLRMKTSPMHRIIKIHFRNLFYC